MFNIAKGSIAVLMLALAFVPAVEADCAQTVQGKCLDFYGYEVGSCNSDCNKKRIFMVQPFSHATAYKFNQVKCVQRCEAERARVTSEINVAVGTSGGTGAAGPPGPPGPPGPAGATMGDVQTVVAMKIGDIWPRIICKYGCKPGWTGNGGVALVNNICMHHCSSDGWCGNSYLYKTAGSTDCTGFTDSRAGFLKAGEDDQDEAMATVETTTTNTQATSTEVARTVFEGIIAACCLFAVYIVATRKTLPANKDQIDAPAAEISEI